MTKAAAKGRRKMGDFAKELGMKKPEPEVEAATTEANTPSLSRWIWRNRSRISFGSGGRMTPKPQGSPARQSFWKPWRNT